MKLAWTSLLVVLVACHHGSSDGAPGSMQTFDGAVAPTAPPADRAVLQWLEPLAPGVNVLGHQLQAISAVDRGSIWLFFADAQPPGIVVQITAPPAADSPAPFASTEQAAIYFSSLSRTDGDGGDATSAGAALASKVAEALKKNHARPVPPGLLPLAAGKVELPRPPNAPTSSPVLPDGGAARATP